MMKTQTVQIERREPVVRVGEEGKRMEPPMGPQVVKVSHRETDGAVELIEIEVNPNMGPPLHFHPGFDEAFYVLEGTLTLKIGDRLHHLPPRSGALVPTGVVHTWKNETTERVRFIQVTAPGGMEQMLEAFAARPLLSLEEMAQLADLHGTTIVGPPL